MSGFGTASVLGSFLGGSQSFLPCSTLLPGVCFLQSWNAHATHSQAALPFPYALLSPHHILHRTEIKNTLFLLSNATNFDIGKHSLRSSPGAGAFGSIFPWLASRSLSSSSSSRFLQAHNQVLHGRTLDGVEPWRGLE